MHLLEFEDVLLSILRWFLGLSSGCLLGLLFAIIGNFRYIKRASKFTNDFLRAIPIIGLIPVVQMNIGINEFGKIGLISWAVLFPVWITVRNALNDEFNNTRLLLLASNKSRTKFFRFYTLPKLFGGFLEGIELAIGIAWLAVVAGEWIGTYTLGFWSGGLGYRLTIGYELNNWPMVHLSLLVFGVLGFLSAYIWRWGIGRYYRKNGHFNPLNYRQNAK